jgi:hypothetical protein
MKMAAKHIPFYFLFFTFFFRMLWKFAQDYPHEIEALYYMSGTLVNTRNDVIKLVPGSKYEEAKKEFSALKSVHVHSLFKRINNKSAEMVSGTYISIVVTMCCSFTLLYCCYIVCCLISLKTVPSSVFAAASHANYFK